VASVTGSTVSQHTDTLGSIVTRTNVIRGVVGTTVYEPYGSLGTADPYEQRPGFTGHMTDAATTLSYMQQRYYDPIAMRFVSVDPVAASTTDGGNFNRYWYANNNPYKFTDPDGRFSLDNVIDAGMAIYDAGQFLGAAAAATVGAITGNEALTNAGLEGMAETGANLATSAAAAVIPGVSAGMLRAAKAADNAADAAKSTSRAEPASERSARNIGRQVERDLGKDARRALHDAKESGAGDRTMDQLKQDARDLYSEAGMEIPKWLE
jgi:RHS repeat-associated protein